MERKSKTEEPLQSDVNNRQTVVAVVSVYLVSSFGLIMTPAVHNLSVVFSDVPYGIVSMLVTIPNLLSVGISLLLSTPLATKIPYRTILIVGLTCFVVGGVFPLFTSSFALTLACRVIFGVGYGIVVSQGNSIAVDFYSGETLNRVLSYCAMFGNGFCTFGIILGGIISDINVHYIWLCHIIGMFPLIMVTLFVPKDRRGGVLPEDEKLQTVADEMEKETKKSKIPAYVYVLGLEYGLAYMVSKCVMLILSSVMFEENIGTAALAGLLIAFNRAGAALGGAIFSVVYKHLKVFTIPTCILVETLTVAVCWRSSDAAVLGICIMFFGIIQFVIHPTIFAGLSKRSPEVSGRSSSLILAMVNVGGFVPSVYLSVVSSITGEMDFRFAIFILVILAAGLTILSFVRSIMIFRTKYHCKL